MILENPYIKNCYSSTFSVLFDDFNWKSGIKFIHSLIQYPEWRPSIDVLQYVWNLEELKNDPNLYFVFDASTEGFCPFKNFFFHNLYYACDKHQINPRKIIFVSANMQDKKNIEDYNRKNNIKQSIKVFCFLSFKKMIHDMIENDYDFGDDSQRALEHFRFRCFEKYKGTQGLSLSRVNREHRILANFLLYQKGLSQNFVVSQDKITHDEKNFIKKHFGLGKNFDAWARTLPKIADTTDFETNHALQLSPGLHNSTLFQIVNETHADNFDNTSLFYSEKTFRSMGHMQPFVIFGQQHCNKRLEDFGFKLFRTEFDYEFDAIENTRDRYQELLKTVDNLVKYLDSLPLHKQVEWRFSQAEVLRHNFELLMDINYYKTDFEALIQEL